MSQWIVVADTLTCLDQAEHDKNILAKEQEKFRLVIEDTSASPLFQNLQGFTRLPKVLVAIIIAYSVQKSDLLVSSFNGAGHDWFYCTQIAGKQRFSKG